MLSRVTVGFLVAPLVMPLGMPLTSDLHSNSFPDQVVEGALTFVVWYIYPLFFVVIFALPLYLFLNRFDFVRWWTSFSSGLLVGGIGAISINGQAQFFYVKLVILGGISGLIFWFIAKHERPPDNKSY